MHQDKIVTIFFIKRISQLINYTTASSLYIPLDFTGNFNNF